MGIFWIPIGIILGMTLGHPWYGLCFGIIMALLSGGNNNGSDEDGNIR